MKTKNVFKNINIPVFIMSLAAGLFFVYVTIPKMTTIVVYPNPHLKEKLQYRDATDTCFKFDEVQVKCPHDESKIQKIPVQS